MQTTAWGLYYLYYRSPSKSSSVRWESADIVGFISIPHDSYHNPIAIQDARLSCWYVKISIADTTNNQQLSSNSRKMPTLNRSVGGRILHTQWSAKYQV